MIFDVIVFTVMAFAGCDYLINGNGPAGALALLLGLIQIGRILRDRRQRAY